MRWVPASHGKSAKAGQCLPPSGSAHLKLSAGDAAPGTDTLSFVHPGLKKDDLLPKFATTQVAKKSLPQRPAPLGVKSSLVTRVSHKHKHNPSQSTPGRVRRAAALSVWPRHEGPRFGPVSAPVTPYAAKGAAPLISSVPLTKTVQPKASNVLETQASGAQSVSERGHHTPPALVAAAPRTPTIRAHHTPPVAPIQTAIAPKPQEKPPGPAAKPTHIGTIVDPANAVPEQARQNLNTENPAASTAGFAITGAARPKRLTPVAAALAAPKAPVFRPKPILPRLPTDANKCLSYALYYEARHEGSEAQAGLAKVIMSRVKSRHYPDSVCGVVYQNAHLRGRCAFSFACDGLLEQPESSLAWTAAQQLATAALCGIACSAQKGKTPSVQNVRKGARRVLTTGSVNARQITDRQMKHMGRDGVNGAPHKLTPVF